MTEGLDSVINVLDPWARGSYYSLQRKPRPGALNGEPMLMTTENDNSIPKPAWMAPIESRKKRADYYFQSVLDGQQQWYSNNAAKHKRRYWAYAILVIIFGALTASPEADALPAVDFDAPPRTAIELLPNLGFGARLEFEYQVERDFDLDASDPEDLRVAEPLLSTVLLYKPLPELTFFANLDLSRTVVDDDENKRQDETSLVLNQLWLSLTDVLGDATFKLGRQRFNDKREWLYDDELDGGRLLYPISKFLIDLSVSERHDTDLLLHNDEDRITNYVAHLHYFPDEDSEYGAYLFGQDDRKESQEDPLFFGVHAHGEPVDDLKCWLELALVGGDNGANRIRAVGFDVGATYEFDLPFEPALTLAYAFGSGDADPADGTDGNFRQTGLQDNQSKYNGVVRLKYYGEMLDPDLSNLGVTTVGFGVRPIHDISFDIVHHYFRQIEASAAIRNADLDVDPDGIHSELGHEIDFVAGYRFRPHHKGSLIVGYFVPGEAFRRHDDALFVEFQLRYEL